MNLLDSSNGILLRYTLLSSSKGKPKDHFGLEDSNGASPASEIKSRVTETERNIYGRCDALSSGLDDIRKYGHCVPKQNGIFPDVTNAINRLLLRQRILYSTHKEDTITQDKRQLEVTSHRNIIDSHRDYFDVTRTEIGKSSTMTFDMASS
ncbi:hypothetical protein V1478_007269 [Vespula squamosa]|uniref:Uncharacterized protein n=1 Tax=Vespula squamosa TaxID=30214 RepID=A0ABD2B2V1_VESSQ